LFRFIFGKIKYNKFLVKNMNKEKLILKTDNQKEKLNWQEKVYEFYRGEVHSHSNWSDRKEFDAAREVGAAHADTRLLQYAEKLGLDFVVFSEHASDPGNPKQLDESHPISESLLREKKEIDTINASDKYNVKAYAAVEVSIFFNETGDVVTDLPNSVMNQLDLVVASRHAISEQREPQKIKESLIKSIENPDIDIIGHPYRGIEFYEHDWNYFKKYYSKDSELYQELENIDKNKEWDKVKQIVGKNEPTSEHLRELNKKFTDLKNEYWQVWDEVLLTMEKEGKPLEINLNVFNPEGEYYRTLLTRAATYSRLQFSLVYDFHNLEQLKVFKSKDSKNESPSDIKNPGRARGVQRLLDTIDLLESLNISSSRIINSSQENFEKFLAQRSK
jgi:histidinol phosphatase-like PHP family hydrolase